jgi:diazepam-binding inhibitor (GABA receptor modulator, acyl-CoA-binding protein)
MSDLDARFKQAADDAQQLPERPDNDTMLTLYALYKQGSQGDVSGDKPGFFDFVGVAKYEAWEKRKGTDPGRSQAEIHRPGRVAERLNGPAARHGPEHPRAYSGHGPGLFNARRRAHVTTNGLPMNSTSAPAICTTTFAPSPT